LAHSRIASKDWHAETSALAKQHTSVCFAAFYVKQTEVLWMVSQASWLSESWRRFAGVDGTYKFIDVERPYNGQ
jgi:hypothetical protein